MHRRSLAVLAAAVTLAFGAAACSGSGDGGAGGPSTAGPTSFAGKTLTVWYMDGDLSARTQAAVNTAFEKATGAKVNVQIQEWTNINTRISTALSQDDPPDVIEIGNTDVPLFAAAGALSDITSDVPGMDGGQSWLPGLVGPATVGGKVYAAPLFAGNRAVIYNKQIWGAAGITAPPTSYAELTADLDKIKAKNPSPDFSAFYFPGEYWYGALQFVWDAGGQLATDKGGTWSGALESPAAQLGLAAWKNFQNTYSTAASRNTGTMTPDQASLFAGGKTATILDTSVNTVLKDDPALKDQIGTFPFPSVTPGENQPVFLGGSDLAVAAKSRNQAMATAYLKAATSTSVQTGAVVGIDGWTPVSTQLIDQTSGTLSATSQAFSVAAKNSVATPATPGWATIESDQTINTFFSDIATGRKTALQAAQGFDSHLNQALNAGE